MSCDLCQVVPNNRQCCWMVAMEIKNFKRLVFRLYILNTIFDMTISVASVVIDIVILGRYAQRGKWTLAILTTLPVILPTLVFANVYMSDGYRKYDKRVDNKKDEKIGSSGIVMRWLRRFIKYFGGTFFLRFIAWTWYLKALIFGVNAMREPKKFLKMEQPDMHWSRELLVRLDFFQAALENAPQCVIQVYILLTDASEDKLLGCLTLIFAFLDFVRVATSIRWNVNRGPVLAPTEYGTRLWKFLNLISWIFLYIARCAAMSLIVGTTLAAQGLIIIVPIAATLFHCGIVSFLISRLKLGQASKKLFVTTFISIFFLPDLDNHDAHKIIQFYYTLTLLENIFMIIPWGYDLSFTGFCFVRAVISNGTTTTIDPFVSTTIMTEELETTEEWDPSFLLEESESECLIDPMMVVLIVPTLTIAGVLFRMAAAQKMNAYKNSESSSHSEITEEGGKTMEEKLAHIYSRQWTKMTVQELWTAFSRMLRKEVVPKERKNKSQISSIQLKEGFDKRQNDFQKSFKILMTPPLILCEERKNLEENCDKNCTEKKDWI